MITRSSIENLKHHLDLYQVVADYVSLQKSGSAWKGLSPFTQEKTPSFFVYPDRGFFYCFSTSQGGDAIKFLQIKENFTFVESLEALADRFNFKLEYENRDGRAITGQSGSRMKQLRLVHELATSYYRKAFEADYKEAEEVRSYWLEQRGFTLEDAQAHGVGYAPADASRFYDYLRKQAVPNDILEGSGLFFPKGNRSGPLMARFRGRLMVPIRDLTGNTIAFTGRKLAQTPSNDPAFEAKYVNSPKTDLFNKGTLLFGLHLARKHVSEENPFVMVEGQIDAIRCWTKGFEQVIATQGTAITDIQLGKLKNYCSQLIMCLDGDSAGTKAAMRVLPMALAVGLELRFVRLSAGDDPDTYLMREGRDGFQALLDSSKSSIPFLVESFFASENRDASALSRSAEKCFEIIGNSGSMIVKSRMLEELANQAQLDVRLLLSDFEMFERKKIRRSRYSSATETSVPSLGKSSGKLRTAEIDLLRLVVRHRSVRDKMHHFDFSEIIEIKEMEGQLLARICAELREDPNWLPEQGSENICEDEAERNLIYRLLAEDSIDENEQELYEVCLKSMHLRHDKKCLRKIENKLNKGSALSDADLNDLMKDKLEIQKRIANQRG